MPMRSPSSRHRQQHDHQGGYEKDGNGAGERQTAKRYKKQHHGNDKAHSAPGELPESGGIQLHHALQAGAEDRNQHYAHQRPDGDNLPKWHGLAKQFDERIIERNDESDRAPGSPAPHKVSPAVQQTDS